MIRPVRALVRLQLLTGARAGELLGMRACDIEMNPRSGVWIYRPEQHKNAFREHERTIYLGPRAQRILRRFLVGRPTTAFLFSPAEADAERRARLHNARRTPLNQGNRPGSNRRTAPLRSPGDCYTTASYRRAIWYACDRAFPPPAPLAKVSKETIKQWEVRLKGHRQWDALLDWRREHRWHPHQLRHTAATTLRRQFGLEAAQLTLGHSSATVTDAVYAERDHAKVIEIMNRVG
jgi:integrase